MGASAQCLWRSEVSDPLELETQVVCEPPRKAARDQTQELPTTEACALNYCDGERCDW